MKKLLIFAQIISSVLLFSCNERTLSEEEKIKVESNKYSLTTKYILPDSLKKDEEKFILESIKNSNFHLTAGDYEDPEDVITTASQVYESIHSVKTKCLYRISSGEIIPYDKLDPLQIKVYHFLENE